MLYGHCITLIVGILFILDEGRILGQSHAKDDAIVWLARDVVSASSELNFSRGGVFYPSGVFVMGSNSPGISAEKFLENQRILVELSVTDEQKEKLTSISSKWNQTRKSLSLDSDYQTKYESARSDYWRSVDDVLLRHQRIALAQLQIRHFLRNSGVKSFFLQSSEVKKFLNFEKPVCEQIVHRRQVNRNFVREKAIAARIESADTLLAQFDEKELAVIYEKWPYLVSKDSGLTEIFRVHLQMVEEPAYFKEMKSHLQRTSRFNIFTADAGGELVLIIPDNKGRVVDEIRRVRVALFLVLEPSVTTQEERDRIVREVGFTEEQLHLLEVAREENLVRVNEISKEQQLASTKPSFDKYEEQIKTADKKADEIVARILTAQQVQYFEHRAAAKLEAKMGPVHDLLRGSLSVLLKLSDKDKERFKKAVEKATQKLEQATVEIETELLMRLFEPLSDDQKQRLEEILGPVPKDIAVGLSIYEDK